MRNKIFVIVVILFAFSVYVTPVEAKRLAPLPVESVTFGGIRYSVINDKVGYVEAWDIQNNQQLWKKEIYNINYSDFLEKDVQDAYITSLRIEDNVLLVTDENGKIYKVDLKTGDKAIPYLTRNVVWLPILGICVFSLSVFILCLIIVKRKFQKQVKL